MNQNTKKENLIKDADFIINKLKKSIDSDQNKYSNKKVEENINSNNKLKIFLKSFKKDVEDFKNLVKEKYGEK
jgi:hypothetical protein